MSAGACDRRGRCAVRRADSHAEGRRPAADALSLTQAEGRRLTEDALSPARAESVEGRRLAADAFFAHASGRALVCQERSFSRKVRRAAGPPRLLAAGRFGGPQARHFRSFSRKVRRAAGPPRLLAAGRFGRLQALRDPYCSAALRRRSRCRAAEEAPRSLLHHAAERQQRGTGRHSLPDFRNRVPQVIDNGTRFALFFTTLFRKP